MILNYFLIEILEIKFNDKLFLLLFDIKCDFIEKKLLSHL